MKKRMTTQNRQKSTAKKTKKTSTLYIDNGNKINSVIGETDTYIFRIFKCVWPFNV